MRAREAALERLTASPFDLLVVGGGIVGARVAYDGARAGLRVALVDAGDFGGATSSASSKLIHGGLRYLATWQLGLVRESQRERLALAGRVAPHLVRELPLVLAVGDEAKRWRVEAGLHLYHALAATREAPGRKITPREASELVPPLRADLLRGCILLREAQTHDSRLTLATVKAAEAAGAVVANYARVVSLERARGRIVAALVEGRDGEGSVTVRCRAVVNAAGPWIDEVRRLENPSAPRSARLSKGVHAVLPLDPGWRAAVAAWDEGRTVFAAPWQGMLLVGATDTPFDGHPEEAAPTEADVAELLERAARFLPAPLLARDRVRFAFAGLRVLPVGDGDTALSSREHVVRTGPAGMISVAGGKLTTHRRISRDILRRLPAEVRPRRGAARDEPLPGAGGGDLRGLAEATDAPTLAHLANLYGGEAERLLECAAPDGFSRVHPDGPDVWAQVHYAVEHEWALTADDVARRRTTLAVRGLLDDDVRSRIATVVAKPVGAA